MFIINNKLLIRNRIIKRQLLILILNSLLVLFGGFTFLITTISAKAVEDITDFNTYKDKRVVYAPYTFLLLGVPAEKGQIKNYMEQFFEENKQEDVYYGIAVRVSQYEEEVQCTIDSYTTKYLDEDYEYRSMKQYIMELYHRNDNFDEEKHLKELAEQKEKKDNAYKEMQEYVSQEDAIKHKNQVEYFKKQGYPAIAIDVEGMNSLLIFVKSYNQLKDFKGHPDYGYAFYMVSTKDFISLQ